MRRLCFAIVLVLVARAPRVTTAGTDQFKVIVNPDNPLGAVERDFLRRAYLRKTSEWSGGGTIHPIDLPRAQPVRGRFAKDVLKKTPAQLRSYWSQQVFSGKGTPPPEAKSTAAAIAAVLQDPAAVAYIPADLDPGGAKVLELH